MGWNPRDICCRTRDFRSRDGACRGLARRRQAPPLALTPGADRGPGLPALASSRTSSHATCPIARRFSCRLRSNVPSAWRGVGLLGHPSLAVWHFTLRFVLPGSWVGHPSATAAERRGWAMQSPSGPKGIQLVDLVSRPPVGPNIRVEHRHSGCGNYFDCLRACCAREGWRHL